MVRHASCVVCRADLIRERGRRLAEYGLLMERGVSSFTIRNRHVDQSGIATSLAALPAHP